jgi:hypothetical protein
MTFAELIVGDHFIWPSSPGLPFPDSINVIIKIASGEDGGGFAIDLVTRLDWDCPTGHPPGEPAHWILGATPVIKLNGHF